MSSNTSIGRPSACSCPAGPAPGDQFLIKTAGDNPGFTGTCGNVAHSPINCSDCCGMVDVIPPYVPSSFDLASTPTCHPI